VAGIGDEIDPKLLRGLGSRAVDQPEEKRAIADGTYQQPPRPPERADAGEVDIPAFTGKDELERLRVADGEAYVTSLDPAAEKGPRRFIGEADDAAFDDQRRVVECVEKIRQGIGCRHPPQGSGRWRLRSSVVRRRTG
jgi:hypothetical protein